MPRIFIPAQLRELTGGTMQVDVEARTLRQVMAALDEKFPGIGARLCQGDSLVPGVAVSIDGVMGSRSLLTRVGPASEIHFLPAIGGG
jgi:molybdopterin synthase sulfur carrier subunit